MKVYVFHVWQSLQSKDGGNISDSLFLTSGECYHRNVINEHQEPDTNKLSGLLTKRNYNNWTDEINNFKQLVNPGMVQKREVPEE